MASELAELVSIGSSLGYEGERLSQFVKEQQVILREERAARREKENAERETVDRQVKAERENIERKAQLEMEYLTLKMNLEIKLEEAKRAPILSAEGDNGEESSSSKFEHWATKLLPKFSETEVSKFFAAFEKVASQMQWEVSRWPLLVQSAFIGRAQIVYATLNEEDSKNYDLVKKAVLDAYEVVPEIRRQKFRKRQKNVNQSYWEYARDKELLLDEWLRSAKVSEFTMLREVILLEDFKNNLPFDIRRHVEEFNLDTLEQAAKAADRYQLTHKPNVKSSYPVKPYSKPVSPKRYNSYKYERESRKCFICGKVGHIQRECKLKQTGKVAFTVMKNVPEQKRFGGKISSKDMESYSDFLTEGKIKESVNSLESRAIISLRDTGASHSCVLKSVIPNHKLESTKEYILLGGFPNSTVSCPLVEMYIDVGYIQTTVKLAVVDALPIGGIDVLIGNEIVRGKACNNDIIQVNLKNQDKVLPITRSRSKKDEIEDQEDKQEVEENSSLETIVWNRPNFIKEQKNDKSLKKMMEEVDVEDADDLSKPKFIVREDILYRKVKDKRSQDNDNVLHQIVVPKSCRRKVVLEAHENQWSGHFGIDKTYHQILKHFWWPKLKHDVKRIVNSCHICQIVGAPNSTIPKAPLQPVQVTGNPFSQLVIDIVGPLPRTSSRHEYMLSIIDRVTRYPEAIPLRKVSSKIIIGHLVQYFSHFGFPQSIQTDRGTYFTSKEFCNQLKEWNINHKLSTPYHPESQGVVERLHQTLKNSLTKYCHDNMNNWDKQLPYVLFALRSVHNVSLGFSPFQIIYGHEVNGPLELIKRNLENTVEEKDTMEQMKENKDKLGKIRDWSLRNLETSQAKMKSKFDEKCKKRNFQVGDEVLVLLPAPGQLRVKYSGPGIIKRKISELNYEVSLPGRRRSSQVFHVNLLKLYNKKVDEEHIQIVTVNEEQQHLKEELDILQVSDKADYKWSKLNQNTRTVLKNKITHLKVEEQNEINKLCNTYHELFTEKLGSVIGTQHEVKLKPDATPIRQQPYKLNPTKAKEVHEQVEYMLQNNLIEPSKSPWSSPVVLVPKKDGGHRLCVDYRKVNDLTISDCFPLPRIEDCVEKIGESKYVSKVDLLKGYWQIPLAPDAKEISAFITPDGLFQCKVMPFGMKNASSTFQRLMTEITRNCNNCVVYLDDIVIYNQNWKDHLKSIERLFSELKKYNLVVNLSKCEFAHAEIIYLGHKVGNGKIAPKDSNVQTIVDFPVPNNRKQVRQFLGLCGYYRKYVSNFSDIVSPLTDLLKKDNDFIVTSDVVKSVNSIKTILSSSPILKPPNWNRPFELYVDASDIGIGAMLCQEENNVKHPIAYFSRKLNKHQKNYSTVEKECLALISALQHFEIYVTNGKFTTNVFSDHNPLIYIYRFKNKNRRLMSWSWLLQEYDIKMHHVKGKENTIADALSRLYPE